ncbi:MAG: helix-turn-helix domain-containing protein [Pseudomonadota bacterium]
MASSITTLLDAFSIAELWNRALNGKQEPPLFDARIVTTDGNPVTAYGNVRLQADMAASDVEQTDCVIISPILPNITPMPGDLDILCQWIEKMRARGSVIATVCTGAFILAEMGFLDGKKATTNWQYARMFKKKYPRVRLEPEHMLTEDDNIICTGAATAVYNLGIHLIRKYGSQDLATACSKALLIDPNRHSQAPYALSTPLQAHGDAQVLKAQDLIEKGYATIETVDDIARTVGISPRHFKRRFKKATGEMPLKYLQRVRIDAAKERLESTRESIDKITWAVGYQDISSFSRLFKQHTRISPKAYREKFFNQAPRQEDGDTVPDRAFRQTA